ncbi:MAG: hypothetical protein QG656_494 [Candidatus Hydrogenedentes bacterium]|nr:hypothetical protein [Candidatus Hydrogenedentota bacterium]
MTFSAHAAARMRQRGIALTPADEGRIGRAMDQAAAKGARESLLLMDQCALVVSVPNRTVITVVPPNEMDDTVFTHIDSAIVVAQARPTSRMEQDNGLDPERGSLRAAE